jgi:hypothetical protein
MILRMTLLYKTFWPPCQKKKCCLGFNEWRNLSLIVEILSKIKFENLKMKWFWKVSIVRIKGGNRKNCKFFKKLVEDVLPKI